MHGILVATSIKQATCIKQACIRFPKQVNTARDSCLLLEMGFLYDMALNDIEF